MLCRLLGRFWSRLDRRLVRSFEVRLEPVLRFRCRLRRLFDRWRFGRGRRWSRRRRRRQLLGRLRIYLERVLIGVVEREFVFRRLGLETRFLRLVRRRFFLRLV